eukprot:191801_1
MHASLGNTFPISRTVHCFYSTSMALLEERELSYYHLKVQKEELDRKMEELKCKSRARTQEQQKLSSFYETHVQQWLLRLDKEKTISQKKCDHLSKSTSELQECIQTIPAGAYASTASKLNQEKQRYCAVIVQLLPQWQKVIETKQIKQISEYESKLSIIQQRRRTADIAFEKEKKLLSLLSIRQEQIQKLENEEKQDALIRDHERRLIIEPPHIISKGTTELTTATSAQTQTNTFGYQEGDPTVPAQLPSEEDDDAVCMSDHVSEAYDACTIHEINEDDTPPKQPPQNADKDDTCNILQNAENVCDEDVEEDDTSKIEQAVGLIEINHHKQMLINEKKKEIKTQTKARRSFRASSKNRLAFSVLESPTKETKHGIQNAVIKQGENQRYSVLSNGKIKSLNDFEDDNIDPAVPLSSNHADSSDDDDFDF